MAMISCSQCGKMVSDKAFVCPNCGFDVRALKEAGCDCGNCEFYNEGDGDYCEYGLPGYPCLHWVELDNSD